jgi:hypothetical protein
VAAAVLLLALQLAPRTPTAMALENRRDEVRTDLDRRGLERWLEARLARVEGVGSVDVHARRRNIRMDADTLSRDTTQIERRLVETASVELTNLGLVDPPSVNVRVAPRRTQ